jgi:3-hydroxyisobutyrate dehydrogenase-like beta-hydroxyacid dehydrogenase
VSDTTEKSVGIIGLGIMGSAMTKNLIEAGFTVFGYDVAAPAMDAFKKAGGKAVGSATEAAHNTDMLITCLPAPGALHDTVAALRELPRAKRILAETSTFALDDKLAAQAELEKAGIVALDCPLSGSGVQALERDVLVYGSGPKEAYDRFLPIFEGFSRAPHYLGDFGNGSKAKYIANLLVAIHTVAAGEAFALARKAGLDPEKIFEVVSDGAGGSSSMKVRGPMLIADEYLPIRTMPLNLWRKDLRVIGEFANTVCCPTPMFATASALFSAAVASGYGEQDTAAVCRLLENMAGIPAKE